MITIAKRIHTGRTKQDNQFIEQQMISQRESNLTIHDAQLSLTITMLGPGKYGRDLCLRFKLLLLYVAKYQVLNKKSFINLYMAT
jgi:hypothetical protein